MNIDSTANVINTCRHRYAEGRNVINMYLSFLSVTSNVWGQAWPILVAILFFGVVIMVHELGHFLFAKSFKVRVNEFALGMGPALFKKKKGEVRKNEHTFYMETQKAILGLAKEAGFILHAKIDMLSCQYENQYIYILKKPN